MMMVVWFLWALQLSGLVTMEFDKLWLITIGFLIVNSILNIIKVKSQEKLVQLEIEKCEDVEDEHAIVTLLMLILRKVAMK